MVIFDSWVLILVYPGVLNFIPKLLSKYPHGYFIRNYTYEEILVNLLDFVCLHF